MKLNTHPGGRAILSIMASIPLAFGWWMSPFAFGFMDKPSDPTIRQMASGTFLVSHLAGIPLLLLAQAFAVGLLLFGKSLLALRVSLTALGVFTILVLLATFLLSA